MSESAIWNYLKSQGLSDCGVAGLMGNLYAESGLNPRNLQNSYEKSLGYGRLAVVCSRDCVLFLFEYGKIRPQRRRHYI